MWWYSGFVIAKIDYGIWLCGSGVWLCMRVIRCTVLTCSLRSGFVIAHVAGYNTWPSCGMLVVFTFAVVAVCRLCCKLGAVWSYNRSVMPLDVLGCTRATLMRLTSILPCLAWLGNLEHESCLGCIVAIINLERGIHSKPESSAWADYAPALCTHRPSLLPIEWSGELFGLHQGSMCEPCLNM